MATKDSVLSLFETNRGTYFSGEQIAKELSLSRTAVWKAVKALQNEGYAIHAVTNRGYCLSEDTDILSAQGIGKYLDPDTKNLEISVIAATASTNTAVREKAVNGVREGYILISNEQTGGRGRLGRSFFSPKDTGFYMSLLLRPQRFTAEQSAKITTMAAVAMCQAIEAVSGESAQIKWVNDIFVRGKKVCGILTEGAFNMENGMMEYAVLGLGVNVYPPHSGFPNELEPIAGAVLASHQNDAKNRLCAEFINRFFALYRGSDQSAYVQEYRQRSFVIGKWVSVITGTESRPALVTGIDDQCHLQVQFEDGQTGTFMSGEISVKL